MDALLLLAGLLMLLAALIWLVMRAFDTSLLWGWGSLLPPVTLLFILRQWRKARTPVLLAGLAAGTMVVGVAMMAARAPDRVADILSLRWLQPPTLVPELQIELGGELNGQRFAPQTAELIDGVLTLREGQDFYACRELSIRLPSQPSGPLKLDVLPQDRNDLPVIELSWLLPEQDLPEARRITHGYSLRLDLVPVAPNRMVGDFHLVLPSRFKTSLSGRLELYTDRLRYRDGRLDTGFDSRETLEKVIEDYLQRRFVTRDVQLAPLPPLSFPASRLELPVSATVKGQPHQLSLLLQKEEVRGWRVFGDRYPHLPEVVGTDPDKAARPATEPAVQRSRAVPPAPLSLVALLADPDQYLQVLMRVQSAGGKTAEGRFAGLSDSGALIIRSPLSGAGEASFSVPAEEVIEIRPIEP